MAFRTSSAVSVILSPGGSLLDARLASRAGPPTARSASSERLACQPGAVRARFRFFPPAGPLAPTASQVASGRLVRVSGTVLVLGGRSEIGLAVARRLVSRDSRPV